jgi:hypothetical protein
MNDRLIDILCNLAKAYKGEKYIQLNTVTASWSITDRANNSHPFVVVWKTDGTRQSIANGVDRLSRHLPKKILH